MHDVAFRLVGEHGIELVDPAVDADLVPLGDHLALFVRVEQGDHRRHIEGRRHVVLLEHLQDARHADAIAVLAPGHAADRFSAVAQLVGLVVRVERDREGAARAVLPGFRPIAASGAHLIDQLAPVLLRPLPRFQRLLFIHLGTPLRMI
jgi:hypothetical protein